MSGKQSNEGGIQNHERIRNMSLTDALDLYQSSLERGLKNKAVIKRQEQYGFNEVPEQRANPLLKFISKFWGLTAWMLEIIIVLSFILQKYSDAYVVLGLLVFNAIISFSQEQNAAKAINALKNRLHINAKVLRAGTWKIVPARELVPGDILRIRIGDFVPADLKVIRGEISVDQSALTGESQNVDKHPADILYSGSIVKRGEATGMVVLTGLHTFFGRTVELVQIARPKLHIETIISRVTNWLLVIVGVFLLVSLVSSLSKGIDVVEILPLMLVLLIGAVPVALPVMFTVSMALGSVELVKQGVLVTHLSAPEDAAEMDVLCVDKTGTITQNQMTIASIIPFNSFTENEVLQYGSLASEEANHDYLDLAFIQAAQARGILLDQFVQKSFLPFSPKRRRVEAVLSDQQKTYRVIKGAFESVASLCELEKKEKKEMEKIAGGFAVKGYRTLAVAVGVEQEKPRLAGLVALHDPPRADSKKLIERIKKLGVKVKMLTGDALPIAREIAGVVGIGDRIEKAADLNQLNAINPQKAAELIDQSDGFAEVFPEDKYLIVKALQAKGHIVGMTGDGVNDAPALRQAELGIAVNTATDVAKGAASMVLTSEGLIELLGPIKIGRRMFQRINAWILNKISRVVLKTSFIVFAFLLLDKFIVTASAMLIMMFMTDFVKISLSTDRVRWSQQPCKWDIPGLVKIAVVLGILMMAEAFGLLFIGLRYFDLQVNPGALSTFSFEILFFFEIFSLIIVREKRHFWSSVPSKTLLLIMAADVLVAFALVSFGLVGFTPIPIAQSLFSFFYAAFFLLVINDFIKYCLLRKWSVT